MLAYSHDAAAYRLVERWRALGEDAVVVTGADLSRRGWRFVAGDPGATRIAVGERVVAGSEVRAIVIRMPMMSDGEIAHVHVEDRAYAASEMQAFLLAWTSSLSCTIVNQPTTCNLGGPAWHPAEWVRRARRLGLAACSYVVRSTAAEPAGGELRVDANAKFVDVVGRRAFAVGGRAPLPADDPAAGLALALARDAEVEMLRVYYELEDSGAPRFVEAGMWIDLDNDAIAEALTERCFGYVHASAQLAATAKVVHA
ncbi:MAG: hypothetical protein ABI467_03360 [Kofleriaceae bacterium]